MGRYGLSSFPSKANCNIFIPGSSKFFLNFSTSGVITPRSSAIIGKWINSPGKTLLNKVKKDLGGNYLPIIAEDLGVITPDVEQLRKNFELPGMKILQFAFDGNDDNPYLPENIKGENWVVYTGTHDNSTSISWWESLDNDTKTKIKDEYKFSENPSWSLIKTGMDTNANLFIAPIQDILSLDDSSRLNIPGTTKNNWKWKLSLIHI